MVEDGAAQQRGESEEADGNARKRERTAIEFPYADLPRSAELTATLGEAGGKVWIDQTQLAVALDMSVGGGTFRSRISAARMFGFIETGAGKVRLSDLGIRLLDDNTARAAKAEAFLNVPLYQAMYDSYNGFALPPAAAVERQMIAMGVPSKQAERARQAFANSAQAAGFIASNGRFSKPMVSPAEAKDEKVSEDFSGGDDAPPPQPPAAPITEKALEYKLVDLMAEAADEPDVMQAIIKVVTFLKTRGAAPKKTGVDR